MTITDALRRYCQDSNARRLPSLEFATLEKCSLILEKIQYFSALLFFPPKNMLIHATSHDFTQSGNSIGTALFWRSSLNKINPLNWEPYSSHTWLNLELPANLLLFWSRLKKLDSHALLPDVLRQQVLTARFLLADWLFFAWRKKYWESSPSV